MRAEVLAQVTRRPDDPGHANRGQRYLRGQRGPFMHLLQLIGPVPAQLDHRPDVGVQHLRSRLVDHHLVSPRLHGPPSGHDDRPRLRRAANQAPTCSPGPRCRQPSVDGDRNRQHQRTDARCRRRRAARRSCPTWRGRPRPAPQSGPRTAGTGDRRVGPVRPRQRGQRPRPHHGRDQRQQRQAAPVLAQPRPNAQPHRSHLAPTPARTGPVLRFSRPGRLTARGVTRYPADASPTAGRRQVAWMVGVVIVPG